MSIVDINWRPDAWGLRKFGLAAIIGLGLIGLLFQFWAERSDAAIGLYIAAGVLGLPALTGTVVGLPGYWLWMGIAFVMGNIVGRVLLALVYYLVLTPTGLLRRMLGSDKLRLRRRQTDTYWNDLEIEEDAARHERLF